MSSLESRLRKTDDIRNYLKIKHNNLMSEKYKNTSKYLNYIENLLIPASPVTGYVWISAFASSVAIPAVIVFCCRIKNLCNHCRNSKVKSIPTKRKKHDKIVLPGKDKLNAIEVLICETLMDSYIILDKFVSINNVLR